MRIQTHLYTIAILTVISCSFLLKIYQLSNNPAGFFADEASVGYDAYTLLASGTDRHGNFFPLFFEGFNFDNVSPYHVYLTTPFIAIFGLNETAVRLTPVFWSIIELLCFYFLLKEIVPKFFALTGMIFLSVSPWHFHISRINMGDYYSWTLLTIVACLFFLKGYKTKRLYLFSLSALFFGLATYSYTPARLTTPLLFVLILPIILIRKNFMTTLIVVCMYTTITIPFTYYHLTNPHSLQRIKDTLGIDLKNEKQITINQNFTSHFFNKYLLHYSDLFLFQKGDTDFPGQFIRRHSIPGIGLLYPYQIIFIGFGLLWLLIKLKKEKKYELLFIVFLLFLFPIADSLTSDQTPFSTRSYLGVIPFHILLAVGIYYIYQLLGKLKNPLFSKLLFPTLLLCSIYSTYTLVTFFNEAPKTTSDYWGWQYGARDIVTYFVSKENEYDELIMAPEFNAPEIFFKFYAPHACGKCVVGLPDEMYISGKKQLFAVTPVYLLQHPLRQFKVTHTIYYPNTTIAFQIGEIVE